jgi:glycosyltransferase involved in cell wall biosynthesis
MEVAPNPARKRILYVIPIAWWGGSQRYVFDMACAARSAGHEVLVATGEGELPERLTLAGIPVTTKPSFRRGVSASSEFSFVRDTYSIIRKFKPDIVHSNNSKGGLVGTVAARFAGVKQVIFTAHGWAFTEDRPGWQKLIFWAGHYATVLLANTTICVSWNIYKLAGTMPFTKRKLVVIHNGVPSVPFHARAEARRILAPDASEPFWIGTIAELHPNKGLDVLIEAFEHFLPDMPEAALVIVGEGAMRGKLERQIKIEGLEEHVTLAGRIPEASRYLHAFDMFVLPSRTEALGYVLLEAGQASLPVVATRVGGIPEIIDDGMTGVLVPQGDRPSLTHALNSLACNSELRDKLSANLHEKVCNEFSLDQMIEKTLALY